MHGAAVQCHRPGQVTLPDSSTLANLSLLEFTERIARNVES